MPSIYYREYKIWLTQKMLATLYDVEIPTINEHIAKIFSDHELEHGKEKYGFTYHYTNENSLSTDGRYKD
jgi:hypothetical protein